MEELLEDLVHHRAEGMLQLVREDLLDVVGGLLSGVRWRTAAAVGYLGS